MSIKDQLAKIEETLTVLVGQGSGGVGGQVERALVDIDQDVDDLRGDINALDASLTQLRKQVQGLAEEIGVPSLTYSAPTSLMFVSS